jgi:hypothetical protein
MNVVKAADNTITIVEKHFEQRDAEIPAESRLESGKGVAHAMFLLHSILRQEVEDEKAHRWLGWAQCILTYEGVMSLEGAKYANLLS